MGKSRKIISKLDVFQQDMFEYQRVCELMQGTVSFLSNVMTCLLSW
jgi:hypothetical protein